MPNITKRLISDQVRYRLEAGWPNISAAVQNEDIWKALEQRVNAYFKMQQFSVNLPNGETIPDNLCLAFYQNVLVSRHYNNTSKCTLPVMPVSLPRNAGIHLIYPVLNETETGEKIYGKPLIPLVHGQYELLQTDALLNDLMGRWGYIPNGINITITKDLTLFGITKLDMYLVVFDINNTDETTILPIPSDYEAQLVDELVMLFTGGVPAKK